jgi:TolB-like protein/DNA-binding winged helix-turn-helix (wHTH) protein
MHNESAQRSPVYRAGDLVIDVGRAVAVRDGAEIGLPKLSFDLLVALLEAAPAIVSIDGLMQKVWPGLVVSPETISQRVKLLRDALGDDSKQPRYVLGVRGRGYRLLPDVSRVEAVGMGVQATSVEAPATVPQRTFMPVGNGRRTNWRWVAVLAGLLMPAIVFLAWLQWRVHEPVANAVNRPELLQSSRRAVAVLPFANLGTELASDALTLGIAESVLHQLASLPQLEVIARSSSFAFAGRNVDAREVGRVLGATHLLEGSVQSDAGRLRVTAQLVDAVTGEQVWSMRFDRALQDIFLVQDEIAAQVTRALELSLDASATDRLAGRGTKNFDAYLAYLQGRSLLASGRVADLGAATRHLAQAVRLDRRFAAGYVALAEAELGAAEYEVTATRDQRFEAALRRSLGLVQRALEIDPSSGAAYLERGHLNAYTDLKVAEADYRRGLALSPSSASGHAGLAAIVYENDARSPEALVLLDRARKLDPVQPAYDVTKAKYLLHGRSDVPGAERLLVEVLKREPFYQPALTHLGEIRWCCQGKLADAVRYGEQALAIDPLSEWTRRQLIRSYLDVADVATARRVADSARNPLPVHRVPLLLFERDWLGAGDAAYEAVRTQTYSPLDLGQVVAAIRMHARTQGDLDKASLTLGLLAGVTWDESGLPALPPRFGMLEAAVGLADVLIIGGQSKMGRSLLSVVLERMDREAPPSGRGELWCLHERPVALALSGDAEQAIAVLQRAVERNFAYHDWQFYFENEPAFTTLRQDPRFQAVAQRVRARAATERRELDRMRAEGLVATR